MTLQTNARQTSRFRGCGLEAKNEANFCQNKIYSQKKIVLRIGHFRIVKRKVVSKLVILPSFNMFGWVKAEWQAFKNAQIKRPVWRLSPPAILKSLICLIFKSLPHGHYSTKHPQTQWLLVWMWTFLWWVSFLIRLALHARSQSFSSILKWLIIWGISKNVVWAFDKKCHCDSSYIDSRICFENIKLLHNKR